MSAGWMNLGLGSYNAKCYDMDGSYAYNVRPFNVLIDRTDWAAYWYSVNQIFALKGYDFIFNHYNHTGGLATSYSFKDDENVEVGRIDMPLLKEYYVTFAFRKDPNSSDPNAYYFCYAISDIQYPDPVAIMHDKSGQILNDTSYVKCRVLGTSYTQSTSPSYNNGTISLAVDLIRDGVSKTLNVTPCMCLISEYFIREGDTISMLNSAPYSNTGFEYWAFGFNPLVKYKSSNTIRLIIAPGMDDYWDGTNYYFGQIKHPDTADMSKYIDITNVTNIDPYIPEVPGYMDDLRDRFSPRGHAGSIGMYIIPATGTNNIQDFMQDLMNTDITDILSKGFFGEDGKQYVMGLRWYYGLKKSNAWYDLLTNKRAVRIGTKSLNKYDDILSFRTTDEAGPEWATWKTSELRVDGYYSSYLDYLSSYQLYLPYYGFLSLDPNDVVDGTIQVYYRINLATGAANIHVVCKNGRNNNVATKCYDVVTQVGEDVPYGTDLMLDTIASFGKVIEAGARAGVSALSMGSSMQAGALQEGISSMNEMKSSLGNTDRDNLKKQVLEGRIQDNIEKISSLNTVGNVSQALKSMPTAPVADVCRSSVSGAESGTLDEMYPYLLITRPVSVAPADYEEYLSIPSCEAAQLSNVHGFTQIAAVKPETLTNAPKYLNEIISLLQAGVYL